MKLLLRLIFNKFILTLLILFLFAIDYRFLIIDPVQYYTFEKPVVAATEYYEVELGEAVIYINISYDNNRIHLVPTNDIPSTSLNKRETFVSWYYYLGGIALVQIIPFSIFFKTNKKKDNKKNK